MKDKRIERLLKNEIKVTLLEVRFVHGLRILERDVIKTCKAHKAPINEALLSSIVGLWLSGPYIVKLFGKFLTYMDSVVKKFNDSGFGGEKLGEKIIKFSEQYHHKVMWIFEKVAEKFTKDHNAQKKIANLMFTIAIGALLGHSLGDIAETLSTGEFSSKIIAKAAKAAIKGKELYSGVAEAFKMFVPAITAVAEEAATDAQDVQ